MTSLPSANITHRSGASVLALIAAACLSAVIASCSNGSQQTEQDEQVEITIDALTDVRPFSPEMRGVAMNNWNWIWGGIADRDSERRAALIEATRRLEPGVIRFAGGLWANRVGWDRADTAPVDGEWTFTGPGGRQFSYQHAYKSDMIDSYADFARSVGAETIMQVNICDDNPAMWADLLTYTNIEHDYRFRYWELGNENDQDRCVTSAEYAERFINYSDALKGVDPSILVLGPSTASITRKDWFDVLAGVAGEKLDVLSFHWYPLTEWTDDANSFNYQAGSLEALFSHSRTVGTACQSGFGCPGEMVSFSRLNRTTYRRSAAEAMKSEVIGPVRQHIPGLRIAITETGAHATMNEHPVNGNHAAAVWLADILGRWAYNGVDILTYFSLEDGTDGPGITRGLLGMDGLDALDVRPTYLAEWLYAEHFGDMLVRSESNHFDQQVVAWASRDTSEPGTLKLMLINMSAQEEDVKLDVAGFTPASGEGYVMASPDPLSLEYPESFAGHSTTINGTSIPDVPLSDPARFSQALDSIEPVPVEVGPQFSYVIEPYSVVALTLRQ